MFEFESETCKRDKEAKTEEMCKFGAVAQGSNLLGGARILSFLRLIYKCVLETFYLQKSERLISEELHKHLGIFLNVNNAQVF